MRDEVIREPTPEVDVVPAIDGNSKEETRQQASLMSLIGLHEVKCFKSYDLKQNIKIIKILSHSDNDRTKKYCWIPNTINPFGITF